MLLYAPGLYTGYGVKTFPGVREAIEGRRWQEAEAQALEGEADLLADLARMLSSEQVGYWSIVQSGPESAS
jgi:N-acetylated-alpha-linked acidic dipeptidase